MKSGKWHVLQQDLKGYIHKNTLLYKQLSMACMSCMRFGTFIENTNTAALAHECGCVGSRMRLRETIRNKFRIITLNLGL